MIGSCSVRICVSNQEIMTATGVLIDANIGKIVKAIPVLLGLLVILVIILSLVSVYSW